MKTSDENAKAVSSPAEGDHRRQIARQIREMRKGVALGGLKIKDLTSEGRL